MSPDSWYKPPLQGFLVRLHGDNGVSIIDTHGNILSRNFTPVTNSKGKVKRFIYDEGNYDEDNYYEHQTTPVISGIFCMGRAKINRDNKQKNNYTIYRNPFNPKPIPGLTDLYSANIINPNLFPICRRGERIKFVDSNGNEKFTVMPIDGKEPRSVDPWIYNGLIIVEVEYNVETEYYTDDDGNIHKSIINPISKCGAIDTTGKWVIYPEWDRIDWQEYEAFMGHKDGKFYRINTNGKAVLDTRFDNFDAYLIQVQGKYIFEEILNGNRDVYQFDTNVYDLDMNYLTTIKNASWVRVNRRNPNILAVRRNRDGIGNEHDNLINLDLNNKTISNDYDCLIPLSDGNYLGWDWVPDTENRRCWYVTVNGDAIKLPENCSFPLVNPDYALCYNTTIPYLFVENPGTSPGYLCNFKGNRINNLLIDENYNYYWEGKPVKSSYWFINILGDD